MARKSGSSRPRRTADRVGRLAVAVGSWVATASIAQAVVGAEIGRAVRQLDERIELQLKGAPSPDGKQPERTHDESIEPWELMSV